MSVSFSRGALTFRSPSGSRCVLELAQDGETIDVRLVDDVPWAWGEDVLGASLELLGHQLDDPRSELRADVARWLTLEPWERALSAFEALAVQPDPAVRRRLTCHIELGPAPRVSVRLQEPRAHGKWTPGRKIDLHDPPREPLEEEDARALADARGFAWSGRLTTFLDRVAHHPRITVDDAREPHRPRRVPVALEIRAVQGGFTFALALGPRRLSLEEAASLLTSRGELLSTCEGELLYADLPPALGHLVETSRGTVFPLEALSRILGRLSTLATLDVRLPDDLAARRVAGDPSPIALLSGASGGAIALRLVVEPYAGGPTFEPAHGPRDVLLEDEAGPFVAARDHAEEAARAHAVLGALPEPSERVGAFDGMYDRAVGPALLLALSDTAGLRVEWRGNATYQVLGVATRGALQLKVTDRRDWLGLDGGVEVDGALVSLAALLEAVRERKAWVRVGKDKLVRLADDLIEALRATADVVHAGKGGLEVSRFAAGVLAKVVERDAQLEGAAAFRSMMTKLSLAERASPRVPKGLAAALRPYQAEGFQWLARLASWGAGGVLADEMGLGKTVQALGLLLARAPQGPQLVVAPMSVAPNWLREAARFAPGLEVRLHHGAGRTLDGLGPHVLVVTTYDVLTRDKDELSPIDFVTAIFDEAQAVKNAASQRARAAASLRAEVRFALSGTPIENHLGELWSLFRVVLPGLLGSFEAFRARFALPIERDKDLGRKQALGDLVRPFLLRRTKAEVAKELPARTEVTELVTPTDAERSTYDAIRLAAVQSIGDGGDGGDARFKMLAAITRLRLAACNARLVDPKAKGTSSKLTRLVELIEELRAGGHRALVFSQFVQHLLLAEAALQAAGARTLYLDGSTSSGERQRAIDAFQSGEGDAFLISLRAGGTGLNLTAADYVIHMDPWWNPAVEDQATDRAHRIGQTRPVTVVRLVAEGTIEAAVLELHAHKRALADALLEGTEKAGSLSERELAALIRA